MLLKKEKNPVPKATVPSAAGPDAVNEPAPLYHHQAFCVLCGGPTTDPVEYRGRLVCGCCLAYVDQLLDHIT